ncbi:MAG: PAS domain S-box protein [bacterium]
MRRSISRLLSFLAGSAVFCILFGIQDIIIGHPPIIVRYYSFPFVIGGFLGLIFFIWRIKLKESRGRTARLNLMLRIIQNVDKLLVKEGDRERLIQGICNTLVENKGYYLTAWIVLLGPSGGLVTTAEAGWDEDFLSLSLCEEMNSNQLPPCIKRALSKSEVVFIDTPALACPECPLASQYPDRGVMTVRLEHGGKIYGALSVSTAKHFMADERDQGLIEEVAEDIAFALHSIDLAEDRKRKDRELQIILDAVPAMVFYKDTENRIVRVNDSFVRATGLSRKEIIEKSCFHLFPGQGDDFWRDDREVMETGCPKRNITEQMATAQGLRWFETDKIPYRDDQGNIIGIIGFSIDITEKREAEEALQRSEKRFRDLVENSLIGIAIIQEDRIIYRNPEYERIFGPESAFFHSMDFCGIHSEDVERVRSDFSRLTSGEVRNISLDFRFYPRGGHAMKWVSCRTTTTEYQGKEAILINMMDISRAKELENLVRIQDKMTSLGRVAAGIAHEIRNPLSGINIYLNTLEKIYDKGEDLEKVKRIISQIQSASGKIESVIRRVMDFSRPCTPKLLLTDINHPIEEALGLASTSLRKMGITLEKHLAKRLPTCLIDSHLIEEVILNLITNASDAIKHMEGEKRIRISSSMQKSSIILTISDSGLGIPPQIQGRIFDPFYTTKTGSTGIGLSICHRIITDHGGSLNLGTSEWGGAEFKIEIPTAQGNGRK